jgi:chemotaxis protein MotB
MMLIFVSILFLACVSKSKYLELESDLVSSNQQVEQQENNLKELDAKYQDLSTKHEALINENLQLTSKSENLSHELHKERSVVQEKDKAMQELENTRKKIESGLKDQIASQEIKLEELEGKLKVTFIDKILFNSGSARLNERGQQLLLEFAESFKESKDQNIMVEGHTDDVSVGAALKTRFPSNWELSTARATAVVTFLQDRAGLEPERLSATGYSYYQPLAPNDTEDGRSQNRRIEIILVSSR